MSRRDSNHKAGKLRINAVGSYGFMNFGDDLFVSTVRQNVDALWPRGIVRTFVPKASKTYSSTGLVGKSARLLAATIGVVWGHVVAFCGGSIMQDVSGVARLRLQVMRWRRIEALGVSIGPFYTDAASTRVVEMLRHMQRLVVRDPASAKRLEDASAGLQTAIVGGDLVCLNSFVRSTSRDSSLITICPSAAAGVDETTLQRQVLSGLNEWSRARGQTPRVLLLALSKCASSNDLPLCESLAATLQEAQYDVRTDSYDRLGLEETCAVLAGSGMVLSVRLHGAIVAYLSDVPFLLVGHHAKCVDFGADIGADPRTIIGNDALWSEGVRSLLDTPMRFSISPAEYRSRASTAYFGMNANLS